MPEKRRQPTADSTLTIGEILESARLHALLLDDCRGGWRGQKLDQNRGGLGFLGIGGNASRPGESLAVLKLFRQPADQLVTRCGKNFHWLGNHDIRALMSASMAGFWMIAVSTGSPDWMRLVTTPAE